MEVIIQCAVRHCGHRIDTKASRAAAALLKDNGHSVWTLLSRRISAHDYLATEEQYRGAGK